MENIFKKTKEELPVRDCSKICISFTPRLFTTPQRESMKKEEDTVRFIGLSDQPFMLILNS